MNILIIQENGHHERNRNFRECFCLKRGFEHHGKTVDIWGKGHDNFSETPDWKSYDLIFAIENWDWMPDVSNINIPTFIWAIDAHCKGPKVYEQYGFDKVLHSSPVFAKDNCWLPNCYDDSLIKPMNQEKLHDVGFCGNVVNRGEFIGYMMRNYQMRFDEMVIGPDMVEAVNSYKIHWNVNISVDINYRNFETMGCGTCLLTSFNEHYEALGFKSEENCLIWKDITQMNELITKALGDNEWRESISKNGYELVVNNHTYKHRAKTILEMIK